VLPCCDGLSEKENTARQTGFQRTYLFGARKSTTSRLGSATRVTTQSLRLRVAEARGGGEGHRYEPVFLYWSGRSAVWAHR
jgi:hypothetical protein